MCKQEQRHGASTLKCVNSNSFVPCQAKRHSTCSVYYQIGNRNLNKNMIILIKRIVVLLFVTASLVMVGTGCNTAHGFGKDIEKAGEGIQDGTK